MDIKGYMKHLSVVIFIASAFNSVINYLVGRSDVMNGWVGEFNVICGVISSVGVAALTTLLVMAFAAYIISFFRQDNNFKDKNNEDL